MSTLTAIPLPTVVDDPMTPVGERLVRTAGRLFYEDGIRAVGVELIAAEAQTTKKTLYDRFGSKDALVVLYLRRRAAEWQAVVHSWLAEHPAPGPDRVLAVFDAMQTWLERQRRGCAFVNAYAEFGGTDHPALPVIRAEKVWMRTLFTALAEEAGCADPPLVAAQVHLLYEGALVTTTAGDDPAAVAHARSAAAVLLDQGVASARPVG